MKSDIVFKQINEILPVETAHNIGKKQVMITNDFCQSTLTQAAMGELASGDIIEAHRHPTMEEFYVFTEGDALFVVDNKDYQCNKDTFIKIPINTLHHLKANAPTKFIYWGIAI